MGLACAWTASRMGCRVTVVDPAPAQGATHAAAGMLAAAAETTHTERSFSELLRAGAQAYPGFVADVSRCVRGSTGYRTTATVVVGADAADRQALGELADLTTSLGLDVERLTTREARKLIPLLAPSLSGAFVAPRDHQVDPRVLAATLLRGLGDRGAQFVRESAVSVHGNAVDLSSGRVTADAVVVANGVGAGSLPGLPLDLTAAVRPVYGDIIRLAPAPAGLDLPGTLRGLVNGHAVYLVPRADGSVVLGATTREDGRAGVSLGGVHELLRDAIRVMPAVQEYEIAEVIARARPMTRDNLPLLGRLTPGVVLATGFGRNGILLAPIAAAAVMTLLDMPAPDWAEVPDLSPVDPYRIRPVEPKDIA